MAHLQPYIQLLNNGGVITVIIVSSTWYKAMTTISSVSAVLAVGPTLTMHPVSKRLVLIGLAQSSVTAHSGLLEDCFKTSSTGVFKRFPRGPHF